MISVTTGGVKGGRSPTTLKKEKKKKTLWKCPFGFPSSPSSRRNAVKRGLQAAPSQRTCGARSPLLAPGPSNIRHCYWDRTVCFYVKWAALWVPGHTPERDCAEWRRGRRGGQLFSPTEQDEEDSEEDEDPGLTLLSAERPGLLYLHL